MLINDVNGDDLQGDVQGHIDLESKSIKIEPSRNWPFISPASFNVEG
jgi:hypothetical protein